LSILYILLNWLAVWRIAVSYAKPVNVYVVAGGCYAFSEGRTPRGVYEASVALSSPKETRSRRRSMLDYYCCVLFLSIVGSCWYLLVTRRLAIIAFLHFSGKFTVAAVNLSPSPRGAWFLVSVSYIKAVLWQIALA
jgi:hypothetical protein